MRFITSCCLLVSASCLAFVMASTEETLALVRQMRANHELHVDHSDHPTNVGHANHAAHAHSDEHDDHLDKFEKFIGEYKKSYADKEEVKKRLAIFEENLKKIEELNKSDKATAVFGINHFADLTKEELPGGGLGGFKPKSH